MECFDLAILLEPYARTSALDAPRAGSQFSTAAQVMVPDNGSAKTAAGGLRCLCFLFNAYSLPYDCTFRKHLSGCYYAEAVVAWGEITLTAF